MFEHSSYSAKQRVDLKKLTKNVWSILRKALHVRASQAITYEGQNSSISNELTKLPAAKITCFLYVTQACTN